MSALSSKIEGAARTQQVSKTMSNCVPQLKKAMKQMDKAGVGASMTEFEKVFEDMDVKTGEIDQLMEGMYAASIEQDEVNNLI